MRGLRRDRCRPLHRPDRTRCRVQHPGRQHARIAGERYVCADRRALQGVHHRRSTHAVAQRVQCDVKDFGRAARTRQIHPGDHRSAENPGDGPVALPAVQPETNSAGADPWPARERARQGRRGIRSPRTESDFTGGGGQHARCAVAARSGNCARCRKSRRGVRAGDAWGGGSQLSFFDTQGPDPRRRAGAAG